MAYELGDPAEDVSADSPFVGCHSVLLYQVITSSSPKDEQDGQTGSCNGLEQDIEGAVCEAGYRSEVWL